LIDQRLSITEHAQVEAALAVVEPIVVALSHVLPRRVAGYLSHGGEIDLLPSLTMLIERGFEVVMPVCGPEVSLEFCPWRPGDELTDGPYGIGQPKTPPVEITSIGAVLVPGVGFAPDGSRIGHGAGYYDRFFARCLSADHDPVRLGVAHDLQVVDLPPRESWDVAMQQVITPTKVFHVSN
jgi:5-formyltetrahydrofolate cyclo-ligase